MCLLSPRAGAPRFGGRLEAGEAASMNTCDRFVGLVLILSCVVLLLSPLCVSPANAQEDYSHCEQTVTNESQLAGVFNCDTFCLPIDPPAFHEWLLWPQFLWTDFTTLPEDFNAAFAESKDEVDGLTVLKIRLTRFLLTGETLVEIPSNKIEWTLDPPKDYSTNNVDSASRSALGWWRQWMDWGMLDKNATPTLSVDVSLADVQQKADYEAAQEAAWEEYQTSSESQQSGGSGDMMSLFGGGGGCDGCPVIETNGFWICGVTYDTNTVTATVTWESCNTHFYDVYSRDDWTNAVWSFRTNLLGQVTSTMWSETGLGGVTNRFYRVARQSGSRDDDGDGFPNLDEAFWGTSISTNDSNGDGILDGSYNNTTTPAWTNLFSSLSGIPGGYLNNTNFWFALGPSIPTAAPFKTVNVETNIYSGSGDSTSEVFQVSSRGRILPYASGANAANGFGRIDGGIYFNHDSSNLYVGVAGLGLGGTNMLVIVLDGDGASGGVTNLSNIGTLTGPFALTKAHNLSFNAATFTPNVGIIVGDKRRDGRNYTNSVLGNVDFGQGVYKLLPTTVTNLGTFNQTGGGGISQWGDLNTIGVSDPANSNAANAGIQISMRKSDLGLTNATTFRAGAIFVGGTDGNNRFFSTEVYGQSVSGGFGFSATTLIGSLVSLESKPAPAYAPVTVDDNAVMMQGFFWDVPQNSGSTGHWYNVIASNAVDLAKSGFTSIWMPPPQKSAFAAVSVGYDPYDHYDLGQYNQLGTTPTLYGTLAELTNAVARLSALNIAPYVDIVINHMRTNQFAGNAAGYFTNNASTFFYKTPPDFYATNDLSSPPFHQLTSFGADFYEVNQTAPHMRLGLEGWGEWLTGKVGYQGYRFDHSPGIEPWYQAEWLSMPMMSGKFAVLEYIGDVPATKRYLQTWINLVDQRASFFDFMLHNDYLVPMCGAGSFNMASLTNAGLVAVAPEYAVTYVENHDTIRPCFDYQLGITTNKLLSYAYTLMSEGYPSVFYHDYYFSPNANTNASPCVGGPNAGFVGPPLKPKIDRLISARKRFAAGTTTYLPQSAGSAQSVFVAKRNGGGPSNKPGCVLVINRALTNVTVQVNTGWASTNIVDYVGNFASSITDGSANLTFAALATNYAVFVRQPQAALDIAGYANGYGAGSWTNNSNGGWGFGAWTLRATGVIGSSTNGFKIASPNGNAFGTSPGFDNGPYWGIYASGGNTGVAYRAFSTALPVGKAFTIDVDNGFINTGSSVGFVLRNGNASSSTADLTTGARFQFYFVGGDATYTISDSAGAQDSGIPYTGTGLHLELTLISTDTYTLVVTDNATGATSIFEGTLAGSGTLNSVALFNNNAGSGPSFDAFFNALEVQ